jgi:hypothetical protein
MARRLLVGNGVRPDPAAGEDENLQRRGHGEGPQGRGPEDVHEKVPRECARETHHSPASGLSINSVAAHVAG